MGRAILLGGGTIASSTDKGAGRCYNLAPSQQTTCADVDLSVQVCHDTALFCWICRHSGPSVSAPRPAHSTSNIIGRRPAACRLSTILVQISPDPCRTGVIQIPFQLAAYLHRRDWLRPVAEGRCKYYPRMCVTPGDDVHSV